MSTEEELKWMTKRYSWRYIPFRYQAMVATIVSALLYFNIFNLLFSPTLDSGFCGTLLRPGMDEDFLHDDAWVGWFWDSGVTLFGQNSDLSCPRTFVGLWWEFFGTFAGLAICGLVMRRAIRREEGIPSKGWNEWK
ncbi:MAG: hypothetical protein F2618_00840 [Actinobacteria bacterium]|nr:hypothetical protein [Actinomycetota bacterium]